MKIRFILTVEYDIEDNTLLHYYGTDVPSEVLEMDLANAKDDPYMILDYLVDIKGEVV